jgi:hypothetical protein
MKKGLDPFFLLIKCLGHSNQALDGRGGRNRTLDWNFGDSHDTTSPRPYLNSGFSQLLFFCFFVRSVLPAKLAEFFQYQFFLNFF